MVGALNALPKKAKPAKIDFLFCAFGKDNPMENENRERLRLNLRKLGSGPINF
jgi:hypothetical protein